MRRLKSAPSLSLTLQPQKKRTLSTLPWNRLLPSPVTSEKEAEEYVSNQTFAAANEHEMQALISILEGEAPADRKAILKALVQREKLKEGAGKKTDVNENELNEDWKHGGYPYKNRMSRKIYEKEKYLLQVELLKLQNWVKETGQKVVILFEGRDAAGKGGTIRRFMEHLNPRGARVVALGKTDPARARRMVLPALRKTPAHRR